MQLTLLVPELIWPEPDDQIVLNKLKCPGLNTLLARSRLIRRPAQSLEATLAEAFGHAEGAAAYAAFRLLGETALPPQADDGYWLCCDPVHLRFHQEHLVLADSHCFALNMEEALAFARALGEHFQEIGRFHVATTERWYLQLAEHARPDRFDVPPLSAVAGRRIERLLPETAQATTLRQFLNEAQMLLHAHTANAQREDNGKMPINSLWLWGDGTLPAKVEAEFDGVWSNNPLALGLANASGVPTHALPVDASAFFTHADADARHLIVLEGLLEPVQYENGQTYCKNLNELEELWFAPLRSSLAKGKISQLRIEASTAYANLAWESTLTDQWKLWRRPQPLGKVAHGLVKGNQ